MTIQGLCSSGSRGTARKRKRESSRDSEDREYFEEIRDEEEWGEEDYDDESDSSKNADEDTDGDDDDDESITSSAAERDFSREKMDVDDLELSKRFGAAEVGNGGDIASRLRKRETVHYFASENLGDSDLESSHDKDVGVCNSGRAYQVPRAKKGTKKFSRVPVTNAIWNDEDFTEDEEIKPEPLVDQNFSSHENNPGSIGAIQNQCERGSSSTTDVQDEEMTSDTETGLFSVNKFRWQEEFEKEILKDTRAIIGDQILEDYEAAYTCLVRLAKEKQARVWNRTDYKMKSLESMIRGQTGWLQVVKNQNITVIKTRIMENLEKVEPEHKESLKSLCTPNEEEETDESILRALEQMDFLDRVHLLQEVSPRRKIKIRVKVRIDSDKSPQKQRKILGVDTIRKDMAMSMHNKVTERCLAQLM